MRYRFLYVLFMGVIFFEECNLLEDKNLYEEERLLRNIEDVVLTILIEDGMIYKDCNVYIIAPIQPYITDNDTDYVVTYNSFTKYHFPDLEKKFKKVSYQVSPEDLSFFEYQKKDSKPVSVDLHPFNSRLWKKNVHGKLLYYNFSIPLFNEQMDLAWLFYRYQAGSQFGCEAILQKQNGLWKVINIEHL